MIKVSILTFSDKGSQGKRKDKSGPLIEKMVCTMNAEVVHYEIVPDEKNLIKRKLIAACKKADLVLTTGGTGLAPRDVAPEATREVITMAIPGIPEAMRMRGLENTPHAMLSRAEAGARGKTLIINLPGSPKAVRENLEVVLPVIPHAIEKLKGSRKACARTGTCAKR